MIRHGIRACLGRGAVGDVADGAALEAPGALADAEADAAGSRAAARCPARTRRSRGARGGAARRRRREALGMELPLRSGGQRRKAGRRRRDVLDLDREDVGRDVLGRELALGVVQLAVGLVEPIGEDAEELPEHLHRDLVLLAQDLEEVGAANRDELRRRPPR